MKNNSKINTKKVKNYKKKYECLVTWLRTSESEEEDTNVIARPFVPKRPALPTWIESNRSKKIGYLMKK